MESNKKNICVLVQELKESYINQKLSTESKSVIDLHLKECKECKDKYDCEEKDVLESVDEQESKRFVKLSQKLQRRKMRNILLTIGAVVLAFIVYQSCFYKGYFPGGMEPTIKAGESVFAFRLSYTLSDPKRGDIVMYKLDDVYDVSRIVAIPGDEVKITDKGLFINDDPVSGYEQAEPCEESEFYDNGIYQVKVPQNCYFMIGDDLENSYDSRYDSFGFVDADDIYGKVISHFKEKHLFTKTAFVVQTKSIDIEDETEEIKNPEEIEKAEGMAEINEPEEIEEAEGKAEIKETEDME